MFYGLILTVHLFVCIVLVAVILLQAGRGGGLSDAFGGGAAQSILGTRGAAVLTKATTICATIFMLTSLGLAVLSVERGKSLMTSVKVKPAAKTLPFTEKPAVPVAQTEQKTDSTQTTASQTKAPQPVQETSGAKQ